MDSLTNEIIKLISQQNKVSLIQFALEQAERKHLTKEQKEELLRYCEGQSVGFQAGFQKCVEMYTNGKLGIRLNSKGDSPVRKSQTVKYLDSREVASAIGKEHKNLIRDIKQYGEYLTSSKLSPFDFFVESIYKDSKGENRPCYLITQKGCELIAHKMTGAKGVQFSAWYINRFHEMKDILENRKPKLLVQIGKPEGMLTATEIGKIFGIDKQKVGLITSRNNLKTEDFGKWVSCYTRQGKPVETFIYYPNILEEIKKYL